MMSARILHKSTHENNVCEWSERLFMRTSESYQRTLRAFIARRWLAPVVMIVSMALIIGVSLILPSELAPLEDKSRLVIKQRRRKHRLRPWRVHGRIIGLVDDETSLFQSRPDSASSVNSGLFD
jgi:hypothetical protein